MGGNIKSLRRVRVNGRLGLEPLAILLLVTLGLVERLAFIFLRPAGGASGEAFNVARAIAEGRGFADAYQLGQGATAHMLPISPGIAGYIYRLFGVNAPAAELLLGVWSLSLTFGTYLLLYRAFGRLGVSMWVRLGSLAFLSVAPTYIAQEVADFRIWEGGLASFLAALLLDRFIATEQQPDSGRPEILLAFTAALLFFVNPPLGLAAIACCGLLSIRKLSLQRTAIAAGVGAAVLACLLLPWALRNERAMGEAVLLRSNTGLELAIANHPRAVSSDERGEVFKERLVEIHPAQNVAAFRRLQQMGGEIAYSRALGNEALAWMRSHKWETARLALRHLRQIIAPEPWMFTTFGTGKAAELRAALASAAGIFGLLGLMFCWLRQRGEWIYPLLMVGIPALALALFQPVPRYTYLFYPILTYAAGALAGSVISMVRARAARGRPAAGPPVARV